VLLAAAALVACAPPQPAPRTTLDFMDDGLAREGVLTRCNQDRDATLMDEECANARRASAAVALEAERAREPGLTRESEDKLVALRDRRVRQATAEQAAVAAARAAADAAYEARWRGAAGQRPVADGATDPAFDVYADGSDPLGRRSLEVAAAAPPVNDLAFVPRPFRNDDADQIQQSRGGSAAITREGT
jgi:hypothetical protein